MQEREEFFEQVIEKHGSMIRAIVIRKVGKVTPDWEDVVSNIYLSIWTSLGYFKGESSVSTFIYPIVNYRIADYMRYICRQKDNFIKLTKAMASKNSKSKSEKNEPSKRRVLQFLSPMEFKTFKMIGQGKTNDEIADELFITRNTVRSHCKKIYKQLDFNNRIKLALFANSFLNGGIK